MAGCRCVSDWIKEKGGGDVELLNFWSRIPQQCDGQAPDLKDIPAVVMTTLAKIAHHGR